MSVLGDSKRHKIMRRKNADKLVHSCNQQRKSSQINYMSNICQTDVRSWGHKYMNHLHSHSMIHFWVLTAPSHKIVLFRENEIWFICLYLVDLVKPHVTSKLQHCSSIGWISGWIIAGFMPLGWEKLTVKRSPEVLWNTQRYSMWWRNFNWKRKTGRDISSSPAPFLK